ncbi:hypothetical protein SS50377_23180 [Spironucleus salmonicida]|nr:hypothetical protein SS50377_23180 [Spironucleus salmonicida]
MDQLMKMKNDAAQVLKFKTFMILKDEVLVDDIVNFLFAASHLDIIDNQPFMNEFVNFITDPEDEMQVNALLSKLNATSQEIQLQKQQPQKRNGNVGVFLILLKILMPDEFINCVDSEFAQIYPYIEQKQITIQDRVSFIENSQFQLPYLISSNTLYTQELLAYIATSSKITLHVYTNIIGFQNRYQNMHQSDWHLIVNQNNGSQISSEFLDQYSKLKIFFLKNDELLSYRHIHDVTQHIYIPANLGYKDIIGYGADEFYQNFIDKEHPDLTMFIFNAQIVYAIVLTRFKKAYYIPPQQLILKLAQIHEIYLLLQQTKKDEQLIQGLMQNIAQWYSIFLQSFVENDIDSEWVGNLVDDLTIQNRQLSLLQRIFDVKLAGSIRSFQLVEQFKDLLSKIPAQTDLILPEVTRQRIQKQHIMTYLNITSKDSHKYHNQVGRLVIDNALKTRRACSKLVLQTSFVKGEWQGIFAKNVGVRKVSLDSLHQDIYDGCELQGIALDVVPIGGKTPVPMYTQSGGWIQIGNISINDVGAETLRLLFPME